MSKYDINVNFDPTAQPSLTSPNSTIKSNVTAGSVRDKQVGRLNIANATVLGAGAYSTITDLASNVGEITGNDSLQRDLDRNVKAIGKLGVLGFAVKRAGIYGYLGVQAYNVYQSQKYQVKMENQRINADYYNQLKGRRIKGSRLK